MKKTEVRLVVGSILAVAAFVLASESAWAWPPQITAEQLAAMQPLDSAAVPRFGTFWLLQGPNHGLPTPPLPCPPGDLTNVPIYSLGNGQYLVDDSQVNYEELRQQQATNAALTDLEVQYGLATPQGTGGGGGALGPLDQAPYPSNSLWMSISQITNGIAPVTIYGTVPDVTYELLSKETLTDTVWFSEGTVPGATNQDSTPTAVAVGNRTNSLFLWCRSWISSNGSGIPDWWLLKYFGGTDIDPNALCPSGDGWTIIQAYQNGWNPTNFYTPPAPTGLTVKYYGPSTNLCVQWNPSPGPVTSYTVRCCNPALGQTNVSPYLSQTVFWDTLPNGAVSPSAPPTYQVMAQYPRGPSAWSAPVSIYSPALSLEVTSGSATWLMPWGVETLPILPTTANASVVRGPQGHLYLVTGYIPPGVVSLRVSVTPDPYTTPSYPFSYEANYLWEDPQPYTNAPSGGSFEVSAALLQSGFYELPATLAAPYGYYDVNVETIAADGTVSDCQTILGYAQDAWTSENGAIPFVDGRRQIKENAEFQLRAAQGCVVWEPGDTNQAPFGVEQSRTTSNGSYTFSETAATNYVAAGFHYFLTAGIPESDSAGAALTLDAFRPFEQNYLYANFLLAGPPWLTHGESCDPPGENCTPLGIPYWYPAAWWGIFEVDQPWSQFSVNAFVQSCSTNSVPDLLSPAAAQWLFMDPGDFEALVSFGGQFQPGIGWAVSNDFPNLYGLNLVSIQGWDLANSNATPVTYYPGDAIPATNSANFIEVARPQLSTIDYYFARSPVTYTNTPDDLAPYGVQAVLALVDPRPGEPGFTTSATTPLMIAPIGQPLFLTAWAKQAITNGFSTAFAYLEQYFTNAYTIDDNGNPTTNSAGLLSPYGEFFPMQPGPAALVTMPDIDPPYQQGTGVVNVIKLQLDVNHDGTMDTSFNGPDITSPSLPYVFWVNNNYDRWDNDGIFDTPEQDDQLVGFCPYTPNTATPDCNYLDIGGNRVIPDTRDLEDFARLWVCGVTSNLLAALPPGSTVTLNWGDVGNPNFGNPTIDVFQAADSDGGIGYLTNETIATEQIDPHQAAYVNRLGPGGSIQLNVSQFGQSGNWLGNYYIWCGVSNGMGQLNLTIMDASNNVLAKASQWIQIVDIKQMYERWTVGDNPANAPDSVPEAATEGLAAGVPAFQYNWPTDTNTPYILYVHGFNVATWEKDRNAETEYKRLYWQGYQGRFGSFRWPTTMQNANLRAFDNSEIQAWNSAPGLLNLLTNLNVEYPDNVYVTAHSHGNVVAGEALRLATGQGLGQVVNTYVAMQAAVAAHTYDPITPNRYSPIYPDDYAQYWTSGAPCYFSGTAGAGTYVNFFNTNDWALLKAWEPDQDLKPDYAYGYDGINFYYQQSLTRTTFYFPQNTYTIFSYCDPAPCQALGAQSNVGGFFSTNNQVELDADPYDFGQEHIYHSGEFRSDYAQRWQFWKQVLLQMKLKSQ